MIANGIDSVSGQACPAPADLIHEITSLSAEPGHAARFGSFSGAVYDTAWLSMVTTQEHGRVRPLFPTCFESILKLQHDDKAWSDTGSQVDGILNSLAALLALATRQRSSLDASERLDLRQRIEKGQKAIRNLLQDWNVSQSVHVGFEILVPALLRYLEPFDLHFDFPGHSTLMQLNRQKLKRFKPSLVYSPLATTLLHSLEAFVGVVEFDRVSHHCKEESGIFGSPASTAAYLINSSSWDPRAEQYLKMVAAIADEDGLVPSAYPTCLFELSWALSTLLTPRIIVEPLTESKKEVLSTLLEQTLDHQNGTVGFMPGVLEDADDTARCLMALQLLGRSPSPEPLIQMFQTDSHFRTYKLEGSPSFSANCNVLLALLGSSQLDDYQLVIEKVVTFLLTLVESGTVSDKWNSSIQYTRMLLVQALVVLLEKRHSGHLTSLPATLIGQRIPGCICRLLDQTLTAQSDNGCWDESPETTAYSIITVNYCLSLPWSTNMIVQLKDCIARGQEYLNTEYGIATQVERLWIEKVSYSSSLLRAVYCSAALNIKPLHHDWNSEIAGIFSLPDGVLKRTQRLVSNLPLFRHHMPLSLELVLIEAQLAADRLRASRNLLFSRDDISMTADKYLDFIPMIWILCNHKNGHSLSANVVWEMVLLSLLNFQVDEYMESVVAHMSETELPTLLNLLTDGMAQDSRYAFRADCTSSSDSSESRSDGSDSELEDLSSQALHKRKVGSSDDVASTAFKVLNRFIQHVSEHQSVLKAPPSVQQELSTEVRNFLIAHMNHNEDSRLWTQTKNHGAVKSFPQRANKHDYIDWVRTTASNDTSCPFSFAFFSCLISEPGRNCFEGALARYFSKSLCRHLATMCRQYNDYGSAQRDAEEGNLNSLDFPDFKDLTINSGDLNGDNSSRHIEQSSTNGADIEQNNTKSRASQVQNGVRNSISPLAKQNLMAIAEFERSCMELAKDNLSREVSPSIMRSYQVFIDVTDMFGQIYVQRDMASRIKVS